MKLVRNLLAFVTLLSCLPAVAVAATSQHEVFYTFQTANATNIAAVTPGLDVTKATLANPKAAGLLISNLLGSSDKDKPVYCIVHLLRWTDASTPDKPQVQAQTFYLYRYDEKGWSQEDFTTNKRLFGAQRITFLFVHFNAKPMIGKYVPDYDFTITKKTPANIGHFYALLSSFAGGGVSADASKSKPGLSKPAEPPDTIWGGGSINLKLVPSDILIKSTFRTGSGTPDASLSQTDQKLADDITYDNEGRYYWDVGFAVPVRKISQIKLDATSGVATPAKVDSTNVFAVLDGYLKPIDVKGSGFTQIPHPIAGLAFAKQPLSKILVGGAWGPHAAELYMGAIFVKQPGLSGSSSCSSPSGTSITGKSHYCTQFTIGINLSVSAIASKLSAPK